MKNENLVWTCGHKADAMCAECYRLLALKAHELAEENQRLRDNVAALLAAVIDKLAAD